MEEQEIRKQLESLRLRYEETLRHGAYTVDLLE